MRQCLNPQQLPILMSLHFSLSILLCGCRWMNVVQAHSRGVCLYCFTRNEWRVTESRARKSSCIGDLRCRVENASIPSQGISRPLLSTAAAKAKLDVSGADAGYWSWCMLPDPKILQVRPRVGKRQIWFWHTSFDAMFTNWRNSWRKRVSTLYSPVFCQGTRRQMSVEGNIEHWHWGPEHFGWQWSLGSKEKTCAFLLASDPTVWNYAWWGHEYTPVCGTNRNEQGKPRLTSDVGGIVWLHACFVHTWQAEPIKIINETKDLAQGHKPIACE